MDKEVTRERGWEKSIFKKPAKSPGSVKIFPPITDSNHNHKILSR